MSKILLLEPDVSLQKIYGRLIEQSGHEVIKCQTAQSALDKVELYKPDLIVLEIQLIDHSGIEFLYELRSYAEWQSIPVIINSVVEDKLLEKSQKVLFGSLGVSALINKYKLSNGDHLASIINKFIRKDLVLG